MKKKIFAGILVLTLAVVAVLNTSLKVASQTSKLSLLSLANIDALANDESDASGSRTPEYSWTSGGETHMEGNCVVTTYKSHIGCLNINSSQCYPGVTTVRQRECP